MEKFNAHDYEIMICTLQVVKAALPDTKKASIELIRYNEALEKSLDNALDALKATLNEKRQDGGS